MNKHVTTNPSEATQELQLGEIEHKVTELERRWINRVVWELDAAEPGDLHASTIELLQEATTVLDVLARVHDGIHHARAGTE